MTRIIEIQVPDIGDFRDVPIVELPVAVGDQLDADALIAVLESDKATLDVPTPHAGRVAELKVAEGSRVSAGSVLLLLEAEETQEVPQGAAAPEASTPPAPAPIETPAPAATSAPKAVTASAPPPAPLSMPAPVAPPSAPDALPPHASPAVRRFARTLGLALAGVEGSGPKGRITREDVEAAVKARLTAAQSKADSSATGSSPPWAGGLPAWPQVDFAKFGPVERAPLSRIVRISGPALARNAMVIPHVTNFDKADVTELESFRKTLNNEAGPDAAKITLLAFTVKAAVSALKAYPKFNASLDGEELVLKRYWNIGVAADTPDGLVVPVVKEADRKGLREIAAEMAQLAAQARVGRISPTDMQGATFTISSLGGIGGTGFTPIINAPEVAILGMVRAEIQPVWDGAQFQPRLIQPLSLSWDHRVVDGVAAARFLGHVSQVMSDFRRIAL